MAITKEERANIARESIIKRWDKAFKSQTGGTEMYVTLQVSKEDWEAMQPDAKIEVIQHFTREHKEFKLPPNKKSFDTYDYKSLVQAIADAKNADEREKILEFAKKISDYDKAKDEYENAKSSLEKAKVRFDNAKNKLKKIEEDLAKSE